MDRTQYYAEWRAKNKAVIAEKKKAHYEANKKKIQQAQSARKDERAIYMKTWRKNNAEHVREYGARYLSENATMVRDQQKAYRKKTSDNQREYMRKRYERDPGYFLFNQMNVRARRSGVFCDLTRAEMEEVKAAQNGLCAICRRDSVLTIDHIKPLSRGGPHTRGNIQFLCQPCNSSKSNRLPDEYAA